MKYIVICLYDGTHTVETKLPESAFFGMDRIESDRDACGFAWVTVYDVKLSTKVGKAFAAAGFSKAYGGGIQMWNPSNSNTQSITAKEKGSDAFVAVMRSEFPGITIYSGSRMD